LKRYVFDELGARRLWLDVEAFNERALTLYRSEGFEEVGGLGENNAASPKGESLIIMAIQRDNQLSSKARS
jgi:RimJ/RimL family protein N-acetyltransferase